MKDNSILFTKDMTKKVIPVLLLIVGVFLVLISRFSETKEKTAADTFTGVYETDYASILENKLKNVLESITGEDTVSVMITFKSTYTENEHDELYEDSVFSIQTTAKGQEVSAKIMPTPEIGGVMIVCSSLSNPEDMNTIKKAAATALNIKENKIYIIGGAPKQ